jgi:hypothetical protein
MKTLTLKYVAAAAFGFAVAIPAFAAPGQYPSQQAQQQAQRDAQAREAANRANQERLQAELKSKRDREAWQESVRQERLARSLAEQQRIAKSDPTNSWQYKAVEKAAPVVKFTRDCAGGAVVSGVMSGGNPYIMGAGCVGATKGAVIKRGLTPNQAY